MIGESISMSSLFSVPPLHPHSLALCILIQAFVNKSIVNRAEVARRETAAVAQQKAASHTLESPNASRVIVSSSTHASPLNASSSSFFASPSASSTNTSVSATPQPKSFNLGLNLPGQPQTFLIAQDSSAQNSTRAHAHTQQSTPTYSKKNYQRLGLVLQRAILNGATYSPSLYSTPSAASSSSSSFPLTPPRYPTLIELRTMLLSKLPTDDGFNVTVEALLNEKLDELNHPDDIFELISCHSLTLYTSFTLKYQSISLMSRYLA